MAPRPEKRVAAPSADRRFPPRRSNLTSQDNGKDRFVSEFWFSSEENKATLRKMPAPRIARKYYEEGDLYLFDEFQTARPRSSRRVRVTTLYDTFCAIRDDEAEHVATMAECQMEDSAMADVRKIDLITGLVLAFIAANAWIDRLAATAGMDTLEIGGVDVGETLSEDGILVQILRFLPFF